MSERRLRPAHYEIQTSQEKVVEKIFIQLKSQFLLRLKEHRHGYSPTELEQIQENYPIVLKEVAKMYFQNLQVLKIDKVPVTFTTKLRDKTNWLVGYYPDGRKIIAINYHIFVEELLKFSQNPLSVLATFRHITAHECFHLYTYKHYPQTLHKSTKAYKEIDTQPELYDYDRGELAANLYALQHLQQQQNLPDDQMLANKRRANKIKKSLEPTLPPKNNQN